MEDVMMIKCKDSDKTMIKGDEVESTKSEMAGVREENLRLKTLLEQIEKDYKALQRRFNDVFQQSSGENGGLIDAENPGGDQEQELVSLRLGTMGQSELKRGREIRATSDNSKGVELGGRHADELKLGLDWKTVKTGDDGFGNPGLDDCSLTGKEGEDQTGEKWPPGKVLKTQKNGDGDQFCQTGVKKARVCVRARCDTPTMNDGCQWRKYGQKISKGNPCPRAYYRCTVSPSCPVRKQVQRCVDDMSILITSYEGTHNHPLPLAATAMASTTSSAVSMLLSGSSTSQAPTTFHPWNKSQTWPYYLSTSPSAAFPTVTLDLTTNSSSPDGPVGLYSGPGIIPGRSLMSFSSANSNKALTGWGSAEFSYQAYPCKDDRDSCLPGKSGQEHKYQSCLEKLNQASSQDVLTETLTEVITSDPSFRSVIAAALSSMVADGGLGKANNAENLGKDLTRGDRIPATD